MSSEDIRTASLKKPVDVAEYLFTRLRQLGIQSIHGVPGDYNLVALDYIPTLGLDWVGSVNELNAAYAADGYARVNGMGAIVTTFGVGELSALNGIAGAYAEQVPVVHIVGCPSTVSQRNGMLLHHTLGNGDFNVFSNMSREISCDVAKLNNPAEIADQIDHALRTCWIKSRPVYVMLPSDSVQKKIEGTRLDTPINLEAPPNDPEREEYVVDVVLKSMYAAKDPILLVDACAVRHRALDEVHALIEKTKMPVFVTPMGKSAINEEHATYGGVYAGASSDRDVIERVEGSDLILSIGSLKSDFNTSGFSYRTSQLNTIDFHSYSTVVRYSEYPAVTMRGVLRKVVERVDVAKLRVQPIAHKTVAEVAPHASGAITQGYFWPRISKFLRNDDVIITETGTANFGIWETHFPRGTTALSQVLWGSIGWSVGAAQGAVLAVRDSKRARRTILFVGDGSFQLTAQEVSTMIRRKLSPIIFLICNEGFTIERFIHGMDAEYNDIAEWKFKDLVGVFGGAEDRTATHAVHSVDELNALLADEEFASAQKLQFVELYMPKEDAPKALVMTAEASAKNNAQVE